MGFEKVMDSIKARIDSGEIAGASVLVSRNGKILLKSMAGYSDVDTGAVIEDNSIFRLASMSKPITAAAVLICCDRGLLSLDDCVSMYMPEFSEMKTAIIDDKQILSVVNAGTHITIRSLLTHSSGLGSGVVLSALQSLPMPGGTDTLSGFVPKYAETLLQFEPGKMTDYSPLYGFDVLGRIVEIVTGQTFDVFLNENLFAPLKMVDTCFNPTTEQSHRVVRIHAGKDGVLTVADNAEAFIGGYPTCYFSGSGGLLSTVSDYYNFATMLLNKGSFEGKQLVSKKMIAEMQTPQLDKNIQGISKTFNWGLGVRVIPSHFYRLPKGSFGWSGAWGTHFWVDPKNDVIALYFMNMSTIGGAGAPTANEFERNVMHGLRF